jgi:hypothetical protein
MRDSLETFVRALLLGAIGVCSLANSLVRLQPSSQRATIIAQEVASHARRR